MTGREAEIIAYKIVKTSDLASAVNGKVSRRPRPDNSRKEDIIVRLLAEGSISQVQDCFVNVNIYVPYNSAINEEDGARVDRLASVAFDSLKEIIVSSENILVKLDKQTISDLSDISHTLITNRLLIRKI
ncbi:MAG: hypothetical protein E7108_01910 [Bacteroidales bacterium]|jgi:hypothetical protein|nr:hypothetical protein [Bacteroidales bacterium]